jgi:hypothetical protein
LRTTPLKPKPGLNGPRSVSLEVGSRAHHRSKARTRISCHAAPERTARAPFSERRMKLTEATKFHRKSGRGPTAKRQPSPEGLGIVSRMIPSAVGAALKSSSHAGSLSPSCRHLWRLRPGPRMVEDRLRPDWRRSSMTPRVLSCCSASSMRSLLTWPGKRAPIGLSLLNPAIDGQIVQVHGGRTA